MRALSIRQPWADLIAHGLKDVENRRWRWIPRDLVGERIALHAGLQMDAGWQSLNSAAAAAEFGLEEVDRFLHVVRRSFHRRGGIVGSARLMEADRGLESPWAEPDCVHLRFADRRVIDPVIPARGRLGMFHLPDEVAEPILGEDLGVPGCDANR